MGLSFHYNGQLSKPEYLPRLIDEVEQVCLAYDWPYDIYEREFGVDTDFEKEEYANEIHGICFEPKGSETICICFLSNGRMSSPVHLMFYGKYNGSEDKKMLYQLAVKTQFSNPAIHVIVINLFRHLNEKYFSDFNMTDEGEFWETNNEDLLKTNFKKCGILIDNFSLAFETLPKKPNEEITDYVLRIADQVKKLR